MTKQTYRLDVDKIKTLKDARNVFDLMNLVGYYDPEDPEDEHYHLREYFTILQKPQGLTFTFPRKSIEELKQELDEKFEELLVKTKGRFNASKETAEYYYNTKFDRIIENFEFARKNGEFMPKLSLTYDGTGLCANSNYASTSFVISNPKKVGYYELVDGVRMESAVKPNRVVRFVTKWLLGWKWKDV